MMTNIRAKARTGLAVEYEVLNHANEFLYGGFVSNKQYNQLKQKHNCLDIL